MTELAFRCEDCESPCTLEYAVGERPRARVRCIGCGACYEIRLARLPKTNPSKASGRWMVIAPGGEEATFATHDELEDALLANRIAELPSRRSSAPPPVVA